MQDTFARCAAGFTFDIRCIPILYTTYINFSCIQILIVKNIFGLYTRYPIVARALGLAAVQPLVRVRRASKGILHTNLRSTLIVICKIPLLERALGRARATIGYLVVVYNCKEENICPCLSCIVLLKLFN